MNIDDITRRRSVKREISYRVGDDEVSGEITVLDVSVATWQELQKQTAKDDGLSEDLRNFRNAVRTVRTCARFGENGDQQATAEQIENFPLPAIIAMAEACTDAILGAEKKD